MKHYIKPSIEELEVELEQMITESVSINNSDATVKDGYYEDSRALKDDWFDEW